MTIELPPSWVYPDDFGTPTGVMRGQTIPSYPLAVGIAQRMRDAGYIQGNWWSLMRNQLLVAQYNIPAFSPGLLLHDMVAAHHADQLKATQPSMLDSEAWAKGRDKQAHTHLTLDMTLIEETSFSGGIFTPLKAFAHYLMGEGRTATVPINNIGINPTTEKLPDLKAIIDTAPVGVTNVEMIVPYYTGLDSFNARYYLGNITLKIVGQVTHLASGTVSFAGTARAFNDVYDANRRNHRNDWDEKATTALRGVEKASNAKTYEIQILGELPLHFQK